MYVLTQGRDAIVNLELTKEITSHRGMLTDEGYVEADDRVIGKYKTKQRADEVLASIFYASVEYDLKYIIDGFDMPKE